MLSRKGFAGISLVLVAIMMLVLPGCGAKNNPDSVNATSQAAATVETTKDVTPEAEKTLTKFEDLQNKTIKILLEDDGSAKWSDPNTNTTKLFADAGKLTLEITTVAGSDYESKLPTIIAGGDIPDLMYITSMPDFAKEYGPKGVFLPLDESFEMMPNFLSRIAMYPEFYNLFKSSDKKIYGFPLIMDNNAYFPTGLMIRQDILKENGIDARNDIKTLDDLYNALKILRDKKGNPPWIARLSKNKVVWDSNAALMFGTGKGVYWNQNDDQFKFGPLDANFKLMAETLSKWYKEKIIHPDIYSMQDQVWEQKLNNDEGYFTIENYKAATWAGNGAFEIILPPEVNGQRYYGARGNFHTPLSKYWVVSSKTKALDNILVAIDACYGKEISEQQNFGVKGDTYDILPDGIRSGVVPGLKTPYVKAVDDKDKAAAEIWTTRYNELGIMRARNIFVNEPENYESTYFGSDLISQRAKFYMENGAVADAVPAIIFTENEMEQVKMLETPINTYIDENLSQLITGLKPISEYDKFVSDLKGMGAEDLLKIYNEAYKRYAGK